MSIILRIKRFFNKPFAALMPICGNCEHSLSHIYLRVSKNELRIILLNLSSSIDPKLGNRNYSCAYLLNKINVLNCICK